MTLTCTKCDSTLPELATTCFNCNSDVESYELTIASSTSRPCPTCHKQLSILSAKCYECCTILDVETYRYYNNPVDVIVSSDAYKDLVEAIGKLEKRISVLEGSK